MTDLIPSAYAWRNNADLIAACAQLRYLKITDRVLDPTWWKGNFWTTWQPSEGELVRHDILLDGVDFRELPHAAGEFDAAVFDPPYVGGGGAKKRGVDPFYDAYGLSADDYRTSADIRRLAETGLSEVSRVVRRGGHILVKSMNYINARALQTGPFWMMQHGTGELGLRIVDIFEHLSDAPRSRPGSCKVQDHSKRNHSTLIVFKKPHRAK